MKNRKPKGAFRPFEDLNKLIQKNAVPLKSTSAKKALKRNPPPAEEIDEQALFERAMADVTPIGQDKSVKRTTPDRIESEAKNLFEPDPAEQLIRLIRSGEGFEVASTPEYIDGVGYQVHPAVSEHLHQGRFAVQSFIDLHGMSVTEAGEAFDSFLRESIADGKRMVLIVHGRGLSSPAEPVLKTNVYRWLTSGHWRKWVLAFSSARSCDGGAGATYVLLRQKPIAKRHRKRLFPNNTHGPLK